MPQAQKSFLSLQAEIPSHLYTRPLLKKRCKAADRVRALSYNHRRREMAVVSLNGYIHCWNAAKFKQVMSKKLPHNMENVCLATDEEAHMYAVGSKANTDLLDARTLQVNYRMTVCHFTPSILNIY